MARLDHHRDAYDEETLVKLDLYSKYLKAWLPVFINSRDKFGIKRLQIFDFFAGPGHDKNDVHGSPLIALDVIKEFAEKADMGDLELHLYFNEIDGTKMEELKRVCYAHPIANRVIFHFENQEFANVFPKWSKLFSLDENGKNVVANLVFVDQSGSKEVNKSVFQTIVSAYRTDFLFFIASSYIFRFKNGNTSGTPIQESDFDGMSMKTFHRKVCEAYKRWLPPAKSDYYLAPFSLAKNKGSNIYGLIFGSSHPAGIYKFLHICWQEDTMRGEANYDIDGENIDVSRPMLFPEMNMPNKIHVFEIELERKFKAREFLSNVSVFRYALSNGFLPAHAVPVIEKLVSTGVLPKQSIHLSYEKCARIKSKPEFIQYDEVSK